MEINCLQTAQTRNFSLHSVTQYTTVHLVQLSMNKIRLKHINTAKVCNVGIAYTTFVVASCIVYHCPSLIICVKFRVCASRWSGWSVDQANVND
jgi:hypothetical protein